MLPTIALTAGINDRLYRRASLNEENADDGQESEKEPFPFGHLDPHTIARIRNAKRSAYVDAFRSLFHQQPESQNETMAMKKAIFVMRTSVLSPHWPEPATDRRAPANAPSRNQDPQDQ
jgi:hypothetical protein